MKIKISSIYFLKYICILVSFALAAEQKIIILHTNDIHSHFTPLDDGSGGLANVATIIKKTKKDNPHVLVLDAGDMTQGTPVSTIFNGKPIFHVMNQMGYDLVTLGNHEFDNGKELINEFKEIANFPIITANVFNDGNLIGDLPFIVKEYSNVKIGIIGLTTQQYINSNVKVDSPLETLNKYWQELDSLSDIQVVLSHLGLPVDSIIANEFPELEVIIGGHSHSEIKNNLKINNTIIAQAGDYGRYLGELELIVKKNKIKNYKQRLHPILDQQYQNDKRTDKCIRKWENEVSSVVDVEIGFNKRNIEIDELRFMIADIWKTVYKADFGIQNVGGTRSNLPAGKILKRHIWNCLPFGNHIVILKLNKKQLLEVMPDVQLSEDKDVFTVVTNSFYAGILFEKYSLTADKVEQIFVNHRNSVIEYIEKNRSL